MKKWRIIFLLYCLFFLGCTSNKDYINSVKKINLSDGRTVEEVINEKIQAAEMYQLNNSNIVLDDKMLHLLNFGDKENVFYMLQQNGVTFPSGDTVINWEIKENIENGKILIVSNKNIEIELKTIMENNFIKIQSDKISVYDRKADRLISPEELETALILYNIAIESEYAGVYPNEDIVYKRFNEKAILENENVIYKIKYYPSGRIKYIADDIMLELYFDDKSYLENIENTINIIEKDMDKYKDEKINQLVDLSRDLEFELIAEKLNKKITNDDIKKIESLEIKGNQVLDNLQKKLDEVYQIESN